MRIYVYMYIYKYMCVCVCMCVLHMCVCVCCVCVCKTTGALSIRGAGGASADDWVGRSSTPYIGDTCVASTAQDTYPLRCPVRLSDSTWSLL